MYNRTVGKSCTVTLIAFFDYSHGGTAAPIPPYIYQKGI
jgi:hypothetical protein